MILEEIVADKKRRLPEHMARISESQRRQRRGKPIAFTII